MIADHARTCGGSFDVGLKVRVDACRRRFEWEKYVCDSSDKTPSRTGSCPEEEAKPIACGDSSFSLEGPGSGEACGPGIGVCNPRRRALPRRIERRICPCLHSAAEEKRARARGRVESANTVRRATMKRSVWKTRVTGLMAILGGVKSPRNRRSVGGQRATDVRTEPDSNGVRAVPPKERGERSKPSDNT